MREPWQPWLALEAPVWDGEEEPPTAAEILLWRLAGLDKGAWGRRHGREDTLRPRLLN